MFLLSTTRPPILRVLTKNHISEAFRIDFVNKSMFLRSTTITPIFSIRGRFDQKSFFMRGVIVPPSKLIVSNIFSPKVSYYGGFLFRGGDYKCSHTPVYVHDLTQHSIDDAFSRVLPPEPRKAYIYIYIYIHAYYIYIYIVYAYFFLSVGVDSPGRSWQQTTDRKEFEALARAHVWALGPASICA